MSINIYQYKELISSGAGNVQSIFNEATSAAIKEYAHQVLITMNECASICETEISSILGPAEQWESQILNAREYFAAKDIGNCRTQLSGVLAGVQNSIGEFESLTYTIGEDWSFISNILLFPDSVFSSTQGDVNLPELLNFRNCLSDCFNSTLSFNSFSYATLSNLKALQATLNIGVSPYNYDFFQSLVVADIQVEASLKTISDLRANFF